MADTIIPKKVDTILWNDKDEPGTVIPDLDRQQKIIPEDINNIKALLNSISDMLNEVDGKEGINNPSAIQNKTFKKLVENIDFPSLNGFAFLKETLEDGDLVNIKLGDGKRIFGSIKFFTSYISFLGMWDDGTENGNSFAGKAKLTFNSNGTISGIVKENYSIGGSITKKYSDYTPEWYQTDVKIAISRGDTATFFSSIASGVISLQGLDLFVGTVNVTKEKLDGVNTYMLITQTYAANNTAT